MTNEEIVKALRCISTDGNVAPDCKGCPFYAKEHLDPELAAEVGTDEWDSCDCNAVGFAAADLIENQQNHIRALLQANDALRERQRWVSVTERLPENGQRVLAYCKDRVLHDAKWSWPESEWFDKVTGSSYFEGFVTHWITLPPAPEED